MLARFLSGVVMVAAVVACAAPMRTNPPIAATMQRRALPVAKPSTLPCSCAAHLMLRVNAWEPIPMPSGFAGEVKLNRASAIQRGTAAYVVTSANDPAPAALPPSAMPLLYTSVTTGATAQFAGGTTWRYTFPGSYAKGPYALAVYDPTNPNAGWQLDYTNAVLIQGTTLTLMQQPSSLVLAAGVPYAFALYAGASAAPPPQTEFSLSGKMTQVFSFSSTLPSPTTYPSQSPQPPITVITSVRQFFAMTPTQAPSPIPAGSTSVVHMVEIGSVQQTSTTSSSDAYVATSGGATTLFGSMSYLFSPQSTTPDTTTVAYDAPQLLNAAPSSPSTWSNEPGATIDQVYASGPVYARVVNNDGSYTQTGTIPSPYKSPGTTTIYEFPNGSGKFTDTRYMRDFVCKYVFAAPDSHGLIVIKELERKGARSRGHCTYLSDTRTIARWFRTPPVSAATPGPSPVLYSERDSSTPGAQTPDRCGPAKGSSASLVERSIWQQDVVTGFTEATQIQTYRNGTGTTICMVLSDVLDYYYSWQGNNPYGAYRPVFSVHGEPLETVTTSEALRTGAGAAAVPVAVSEVVQSHFLAQMARLRKKIANGEVPR